jgi:hypothetical protein
MGKEIERKFLVKGNAWRAIAKGTTYRQGYLNSAKERTVRVRTADAQAFITIKGITVGATRAVPLHSLSIVKRHAIAVGINEAEPIPLHRFGVGGRHALTLSVHEAEVARLRSRHVFGRRPHLPTAPQRGPYYLPPSP